MKSNRIFNTFVYLILILIPLFCSATSWQVLIYMDSSDDLSDMAIKNISDIIKTKPHDPVTIAVQLHAYDSTALRYHINKEGLSYQEEVTLSNDYSQNLIDAARWAFNNNNANHTMLILWNHGRGILDPRWNDYTLQWETASDEQSECLTKKNNPNQHALHSTHRGYLFCKEPRIYLNNDGLVTSLSLITSSALQGQKLDIVAFDCCMGAMLEVGYQIAPYVHYLVGSQSCSLRDGFNYIGLVNALQQGPKPDELAQEMVKTFDQYYQEHDPSGIYTHAALDLTQVNSLIEHFNTVVDLLLEHPTMKPLIKRAHTKRARFCLFPMYSDIVTFFKNIEEQLPSLDTVLDTKPLKDALAAFYKTMGTFVITHCGGYQVQETAHGCAIYIPSSTIDTSYRATQFAKESEWLHLLEYIML